MRNGKPGDLSIPALKPDQNLRKITDGVRVFSEGNLLHPEQDPPDFVHPMLTTFLQLRILSAQWKT
jgi:hypothetical protein